MIFFSIICIVYKTLDKSTCYVGCFSLDLWHLFCLFVCLLACFSVVRSFVFNRSITFISVVLFCCVVRKHWLLDIWKTRMAVILPPT